MNYEVSCGAVVFTRKANEVLYVIVQSTEGYYGFPKGHMEENETEEETALREIYEETGLKVKLIPGFKNIVEYPLPKKNGVMKRVIYFIGEFSDQEMIYQKEELLGSYLMTYDEALDIFQFEKTKNVLIKANEFIVRNLIER